MKFDWYQATCEGKPEVIVDALLREWPDASVRPGRACNGYARGYELANGSSKCATVQYGGQAMGPGVHVTATGGNAPAAAVALRRGIVHRVTRADAAEDFEEVGAWDKLFAIGIEVAEDFGIRTKHLGDYHRAQHGRTLYVGAPSSIVAVKIYEKGKQLSATAGDHPNWVRVEASVRPKGEARILASAVEPASLFGYSRWSKEMAFLIGAGDVARVKAGTIWRDSDDDRTWAAVLRQYGPFLQRRKEEDHGSWAALGCQIGSDLEAFELVTAQRTAQPHHAKQCSDGAAQVVAKDKDV